MSATNRQKMFADYFIESGNAEQAAIKAGYSERYARGHAHRLKNSPNLKDYIEERLEQLASERIASASETLELLTSVMRGEVKEPVLIMNGAGTQQVIKIACGTKDRIRAAELLGKRYGLFTDKISLDGAVPIMFVGEDDIED